MACGPDAVPSRQLTPARLRRKPDGGRAPVCRRPKHNLRDAELRTTDTGQTAFACPTVRLGSSHRRRDAGEELFRRYILDFFGPVARDELFWSTSDRPQGEIGRASCRERV